MEQTELTLPTGRELRDKGMEQAISHADGATLCWRESWSKRALVLCQMFAETHDVFSAEEIRFWSTVLIEEPPSLRAWGSVIIAAAKAGMIEKIGYCQVTNPTAHRANAALWRSKLFRKEIA